MLQDAQRYNEMLCFASKVFFDGKRLQLIDFVLQNIYPGFGDSEIIEMGYMDMAVSHLRAKKMLRGVQLCHSSTIGMPKIMIFEVNSEFFFYSSRMEFHRIDGLNLAV